jgi:hypothetical protein
LRDRPKAVLLEHLPRDGVNLNFGYHVAFPDVAPPRAAVTG